VGTATDIASYPHGRVPRQVRERQVLGLAEELFAERGYHGASMDELARRAGVSKPVIYDLIGSKDQLFEACVQRVADELAARVAAAVADEPEPLRKLHAGAVAFFQFVAAHKQSLDVLFPGDSGPFGPEVADIRRRQTQFVSMVLAESAADMGIDIEAIRIDAAAHALNGAFEALVHWWQDHPEVAPETLADWLVELVLPGLERFAEQSGG